MSVYLSKEHTYQFRILALQTDWKRTLFEGTLAKILYFAFKSGRKVEKRLWFVIKYITLKQILLILKTFPLERILHSVSIYICLQTKRYVCWVNEWRFNIHRKCWTLNYCVPDGKYKNIKTEKFAEHVYSLVRHKLCMHA